MKKTLLSLVAILAFASFANAQVPARTGWWKFDDASNLLKAEIGNPLVTKWSAVEGYTPFVDISLAAGPAAGNLAVEVSKGTYLVADHGIAPSNGTKVNEYTLQIDFSIPVTETWYAFFDTDSTSADDYQDADLFVSKNTNPDTGGTPNAIGCGSTRYSTNTLMSDTWYRMIVSVKNGEFFRVYVNGDLWLESLTQPLDGRYALLPTLSFFQDNDGDDGTLNCSEIGMWDVALTAEQALLLGDATTVQTGIKENRAAKASDLMPNFPNPVAHNTIFPYQVQKTGNVTFRILDQTGKVIDVINAGAKTPGKYNFNYNSDKLNNGIYIVQMTTNNRTSVRKMVVLQ
ncbi:MAG: T9SS type A sorting domain-containing protein [Lentimicrobiaceae bacterium]|jgi:hypothetical protein